MFEIELRFLQPIAVMNSNEVAFKVRILQHSEIFMATEITALFILNSFRDWNSKFTRKSHNLSTSPICIATMLAAEKRSYIPVEINSDRKQTNSLLHHTRTKVTLYCLDECWTYKTGLQLLFY